MPIGCSNLVDRPRAPHTRTCCILSQTDPFLPGNQIIDPTTIKSYTFGMSLRGISYSCNGGFIDYSHLLDQLELTTWYYGFFTRGRNKAGQSIDTFGGKINAPSFVTLKKDVPMDDGTTAATVAASMAFDQSIFYEIDTYYDHFPASHNSAFSPEDLLSNYLGVRIAEKAFQAVKANGQVFDDAATQELHRVLNLLQPSTPAQTTAAFNAISGPNAVSGMWVIDADSKLALRHDDYLRRRNFNYAPVSPCFVTAPGVGCAGTPAFPSSDIPNQFPSSITDYYDVTYSTSDATKKVLGPSVKRSDFATVIAGIMTDADKLYPGGGFKCP
jgi:hypothetical protein